MSIVTENKTKGTIIIFFENTDKLFKIISSMLGNRGQLRFFLIDCHLCLIDTLFDARRAFLHEPIKLNFKSFFLAIYFIYEGMRHRNDLRRFRLYCYYIIRNNEITAPLMLYAGYLLANI